MRSGRDEICWRTKSKGFEPGANESLKPTGTNLTLSLEKPRRSATSNVTAPSKP